MHILVTDVLACPRCGPDFGLIVLAEGQEDRRVVRGRLGCANCRESYAIERGIADLRHPAGGEPPPPSPPPPPDADHAFRVAALLGVGESTGVVVVDGAEGRTLDRVASHLPGAQVVGTSVAAVAGRAGGAGVVLRSPDRLPFRTGSARAVALLAGAPAPLLDEAARVAAPGAHVLVDPAPAGTAEALVGRGLELLLDQDGVAVASRSPRR